MTEVLKLSQDELEAAYDKEDPWGYQTCPGDALRKTKILEVVGRYGPYENALDVACGEGWITEDLPAKNIYGFEASVQARLRWSHRIKSLLRDIPYDLVLLTGALYYSYDWEHLLTGACRCVEKYFITCNIAEREVSEITDVVAKFGLIQIYMEEFPYDRGDEMFTQRIRVFKK